MKCRLNLFFLFIVLKSFSQTQTCPVNINFATGDLTHWYAYTGNNKEGNGLMAIHMLYDSNTYAPNGTIGTRSIIEYNLPSVVGIQVITTNRTDLFGGFPTIPTINGYNYKYSILLGSTAITRGIPGNNSSGGGYIRGVKYRINVPTGAASEPFTMTYAYAMVLENGTHQSLEQPHIAVTLQTPAGIIDCASPSYLLPTNGNVGSDGRGAILDSATAKRNGFKVSSVNSPNQNLGPNGTGGYLQDVWTKGWTEITFDLAPYRGQQVDLIFEADNCVPGGHFAYGYIAIRNSCAGLVISGDSLVCNNTNLTYSVPALAGATYNWIIPNSWTLLSADTSNIVHIKSSSTGGFISVREKNGCADLADTIQINTLPSPEAGTLNGSTAVCTGENTSTLNLLNYSGAINSWISSTDSINWSLIPNITNQFTAENLISTTWYRVIVGKGNICPPDTSSIAIVQVDKKTIGGQIDPPEATLCSGQTAGINLKLKGNTGNVKKWQYSENGFNWIDFNPVISNSSLTVKGITANTQFRLVDQNGVCPPDTSSTASILFDPVPYPQAVIFPADTTICFATSASLLTNIIIGTNYSWNPDTSPSTNISSTPYSFVNAVSPSVTTNYILTVMNKGCPNSLQDTFHVEVLAPVIVDAGRDTSVVIGQPLQLHAISDDKGPDSFSWTPSTELSDPFIADPLATYNIADNLIKYRVTATTPFGCTGEGFITVKVFRTKPDIFVPNAFTPGKSANAVFRPIPVGISSIQYFRIYNRLGQLVYNTSAIGKGWDGTLNGVPQNPGGYVWMVKGTDYTGSNVSKSGTMVLVR